PLLFGEIIDSAIANQNRGELDLLAGLIVAAAFGQAALAFAERWFSAKIGEGLIFDLRVSLYDHVQRMPIGFFTRIQTGSLISRLNNDVIGAQRAMTGTLGQVVSNVIIVATTVVAMFTFEWRLTLLALALLPIFVLPTKRVGRRLQAITRQGMEQNAAMNNTMTERLNVSGAMLVKLFGRHDDERDEFAGRAGHVRDIGIRSAMLGRAFFISLTLVGAVGTALIYWIGGRLVISGDLSVGELAAMSLLVARIYTPLTALTNARVDIMTAFVSFDRVFEVLDTPNTIVDRADARALDDAAGAISLDDVWFTYGDESTLSSLEADHDTTGEPNAPVLRGITAEIPAGSLTAIVGPSGAGKTTLVSLIPRLFDVDSGAVRIDGIDVRELTQQSLRSSIGVVSQDPHLFHDTIEANLRYARPTATGPEIEAAADAAQIHGLIASLPDGYGTVVGERGYRLSGGEKQRLAIARMLLKDPAVVVLDEATSHLDSENEALVQRALGHALEGRTAVVIAHRLSTITAADQILVVDAGRLVEQGTHLELLAADGLYADLYRTLVRGDQLASAD
ncbi:MAG: ABC transporter ATP-binding protein/permease, partial [Acidimicrobiia bacterium]|nr:ABC transporter ATP-binding protein/permease [Acidimicrobiia bacterium]